MATKPDEIAAAGAIPAAHIVSVPSLRLAGRLSHARRVIPAVTVIAAANGWLSRSAAGATSDAVARAGASVYTGQRSANTMPASATTAIATMMRHWAPSTAIRASQFTAIALVNATPAIATGTRECRSGAKAVADHAARATASTTTASHGCSRVGTCVATQPLTWGISSTSPMVTNGLENAS